MTPPPPKVYRLLSLDGGGSWSIIQVRTLQALFGATARGHEVARNFDLIAANSGGSIVAAGLAANFTLDRILELFESAAKRESVFVKLPWYRNVVFRAAGAAPKYSAAAKLPGLRAAFAPQDAGELDLRALSLPAVHQQIAGGPHWLVAAFDYDRLRATFFRSNPASAAAAGGPSPAPAPFIEAVHASTNAPVLFFDAPAEISDGCRYWDGAVGGYNNPVLAAVTEALANGVPAGAISAISIGSGGTFLPREGAPGTPPALLLSRDKPAIVGDLRRMASSILDDPPDAASFVAHVVLGGRTLYAPGAPPIPSPIVRLNPLIQPVRSGPDAPWAYPSGITADQFGKLKDLQLDAVEPDEVALVDTLCSAWMNDAAPNQPIRADRALAVEIGDARYSDALAAARDILRPPAQQQVS